MPPPASPDAWRCRTCTRMLVAIAYERRPAFRLVREPFRAGMLLLACLRGLDVQGHDAPDPGCRGCPRAYKNALKQRSPLFRRLNASFNPLFDRLLESLVREDEMDSARDRASQASTPLGPGPPGHRRPP